MLKKIIPTLAIVALALVSCGSASEDPAAPAPTTPTGGISVSGKFSKNVLIEDYTGTWCQYCPRVAYAIEQVQLQTTKAVPVAIHRSGGGPDPYNFAAASVLETQIGLAGYPTAMLNRKTEWNSPASNASQAIGLTGNNADLGISLKPTLSGTTLSLDVNVKFAADMSNLRLVVYVLENNLIYNQSNSTSYYGGASPIVNFQHDNVLRGTLTDILGDTMTGTTTNGSTWTKTFTAQMPASVTNSAKTSFVAFVMDYTGKVINSRKANLNDNQSFEIVP